MNAGVITFPGSNCDDDTVYALTHTLGFKVEKLWHKDTPDLSFLDLVVLPGGFSYGDYLRSGAMAAVSPILESVKAFACRSGLVIGICNGFQMLCEAGLLPGALIRNINLSFLCKDVGVQVVSTNNPWTSTLSVGTVLTLPIAHGEGKFQIEESKLAELERSGRVLLKYTENPNGSVGDIAGICNEQKNVFGLMPHPERACDLRSRDGLKIWNSIRTFVEQKRATP